MDTLQINSIKRAIATLCINLGVRQLRDLESDISSKTMPYLDVVKSFVAGLGIDLICLDENYYFTSSDNWDVIMQVINPIVKEFVWEKERFDCDNRANLVASLCSLIFRVNTCAVVWTDIENINTGNKDRHYANLILLDDGTFKLWDVDNGGLSQKVSTKNPVMANWKYNFLNARIY